MPDLPAMLRVAGRRCVIVGGGAVARRRAAALVFAGANVTVIAPEVDPELSATKVQVLARQYRDGDLEDAFLVVIATDNPSINQAVLQEAQRRRVLANHCDEPEQGNLTIPAHAYHGPISIAVETSGISPAAAAAIRRDLSAALDPDWPEFLEAVAPFRERIKAMAADPALRQERLRELAAPEAMMVFKTQGAEALRERCEGLVTRAGL